MLFVLSPFLAVQTSFWPFLCALILFSLLCNTVLWISAKLSFIYVIVSLILLVLISFSWWIDLKYESLIGYHTHKLEVRLRSAILLFILSEVFFFLSFFWAFYDASLSPVIELGLSWPPKGIVPLSVYSVPLLNTIILLSSGVSVTWAHHNLLCNKSINISLFLTCFLAVYFTRIQLIEYSEAFFNVWWNFW